MIVVKTVSVQSMAMRYEQAIWQAVAMVAKVNRDLAEAAARAARAIMAIRMTMEAVI